MSSFFNLPFAVRIAGNVPVDGDRYLASGSTARDALIGSGREYNGLLVFNEQEKTLYLLKDKDTPTWEPILTSGSTSGGTISPFSGNGATGGIVPFSGSNNVSGNFAFSVGSGNLSSGNYSHSEGNLTSATTTASHAEGRSTLSSGNYSHAEGFDSTASGFASHTEGRESTASGFASHAEGQANIASGDESHAQGRSASATTNQSHAEGFQTLSSGQQSHAEGRMTTASGSQSHAEGISTTASGTQSHAEGNGTLSSGFTSHAEGNSTVAGGNYSHSEGFGTTAEGLASHAEGLFTYATQNGSHAEGISTTASTASAHAEGTLTLASNNTAHAEGNATTASGAASHSEGTYTTASGINSHAGGKDSASSGAISFVHSSGSTSEAVYSSILGGVSNSLSVAATGSTVLGGSFIIGTDPNTVYGINFNASNNISGNTFYSAGTNLETIIKNLGGGGSGDVTRVQGGTNISTGGTANFPAVNLDSDISLDSVSASTLIRTTALQIPTGSVTGYVWQATDSFGNGAWVDFTAQISGGTNLVAGINTFTGGSANMPSVNITGASFDNISVSGNSSFTAGITANTIQNTGGNIMNLDNVASGSTYAVSLSQEILAITVTTGMTVNLPDNPVVGQVFGVKDAGGNSFASNIIVGVVGNTYTIDGNITDLIDEDYAFVKYIFNGIQYLIL